jgi:outer membrane protein
MKLRYYFLFLLGAAVLIPVSAEQLTTVGIIDVGKVSAVFYSDSRQVREIEALKARRDADIENINNEINQLREQKIQAENTGNQSLALRLEKEIADKINYRQDYYRIRSNEIQERENRLSGQSAFVVELQRAIAFVAEDQGYNVILNSNDRNLLWWSRQVDITDMVIARLLQNSH